MSDLQGFIQAETERQRFQVGAAFNFSGEDPDLGQKPDPGLCTLKREIYKNLLNECFR